jgi:hypothetical protein
VTPSGIEPVTFQLLVQFLNQVLNRVPMDVVYYFVFVKSRFFLKVYQRKDVALGLPE